MGRGVRVRLRLRAEVQLIEQQKLKLYMNMY